MRCPTCGNEVNPGEAFCGQCGTPSPSTTRSREIANPPHGGQRNGYHPQNAFPSSQSSVINPRTPMPTNASSTNRPSLHGNPFIPNQSAASIPVRNQQTGFYQDATEAMTVFPSTPDNPGIPNQGYLTPQQNFPAMPTQGSYAGRAPYGSQMPSLQTGAYINPGSNPGYSQPPSYVREQSYADYNYRAGTRVTPTPPPPQRRQNNTVILIVSICLVGVLISVVGLATLYFTKYASSATPVANTPVTTAATPQTTVPTPTLIPSPTTAPTPAPTAAVTPAPDDGFSWCGAVCTNYGFTVEYPNTWQPGTMPGTNGVQFANPGQSDQFATFKAAGQTNSSASELVTNDLQTNFANKSGYQAPTTSSTATISGETWATATASYQSDTQQQEHIEVYATVHQGKAYIIELQASEDQFSSVNSQYFTNMLGKFQFLSQVQGTN